MAEGKNDIVTVSNKLHSTCPPLPLCRQLKQDASFFSPDLELFSIPRP